MYLLKRKLRKKYNAVSQTAMRSGLSDSGVARSSGRLKTVLVVGLAALLAGGGYSYSAATAKTPTMSASISKDEKIVYAQTLQELVAEAPETFLNLLAQDVRMILADPDLERADYPSVVWQYRSASCVLDVYFKASSANLNEASAIHYEMRPRTLVTEAPSVDVLAEPPSAMDCMKSLYQEREPVIQAQFQQMLAAKQQPAG